MTCRPKSSTRSGTNDYHGGGFGYARNSKFNAKPFFGDRDSLKREQYGTYLGGPVKLPGYNGKDRTFYFLSMEGTRQVASSTFSNVVAPSALERAGDFSQSKLPAGRAVAPPET